MPNILTMPDDEFLRTMDSLPETAEVPVETPEVLPDAPVGETSTPDANVTVDPPEGAPEAVAEAAPEGSQADEPAAGGAVEGRETPQEIDYKAAYDAIFGRTFKAAGKDMQVRTPEEAIQLMQMGVGFNRKMSQMGYANRIIETLKENDLLDEAKINNLIDISKKNPEAIAALVQSAGIEPHTLIPEGDAPKYTPGNHVIPEDQVRFRTSIENIREQGGTEFLTHVAQDWDVTSRAEIFKDPRALDMLYDHKLSGIYDLVSSEVERRKLFDPALAEVPYIQAYLAVGNELNERGLLNNQPPSPPQVPTPVAVKAAVTPQPVTPNAAAARAASVRSSPAPATATPNYLTMSDAEFLKNHLP